MMFFLLFLLFFCSQSQAQITSDAGSLYESVRNMDLKCLNPKLEGACMVGPDPGVRISYWEPTLVAQTIQTQGLGWHSLGNSDLKFQEVHLYDFPLKLFEEAILCPSIPNATLGVRYLSEMDQELWRKENRSPSMLDFIGNWGPIYPRTGFMIHPSPAVSSALAAVRAVSAASMLTGQGHIAQSPVDFSVNKFMDRIQMVSPEKTMCMAPGFDARLWDIGKISQDGRYVWVYWRHRQCCKPVIPE